MPYSAFDHAMRAVVHAVMAREAERLDRLCASETDCGGAARTTFCLRACDMADLWGRVSERRHILYLWLPASGVMPDDEPPMDQRHPDLVDPPFYDTTRDDPETRRCALLPMTDEARALFEREREKARSSERTLSRALQAVARGIRQ